MAFAWLRQPRKGIVLALINACFIAGYTLVDGTGVRLAGWRWATPCGPFYERLLPAVLGDGGATA